MTTRRLGPPVTLAEVAHRAGVSAAVVSRVINHSPTLSIRSETRARVRAAIDELAYRPHAAARSLSRSKTDAFGLIIPGFENPVYARIIEGAESAALAAGCVLLTGSASGSGLSEPDYVRSLGNGRVDGLLLAGVSDRTMFEKSAWLGSVPFLMLNRRVVNVDRYVILDDEGAAGLAVSHLADLGHTRIAHIAGPGYADTGRRRRLGYLRAMTSAKLRTDEEYLVESAYTPASGLEAMDKLLALPHPPTAVFIASVAAAIGALRSAKLHSLSVPDDVSLIAVHDLPLAAFLSPPLTTVQMPLAELGARGVQLLAESSPETRITEVLVGPMSLVLRESTAAPRGVVRRVGNALGTGK